MLTITCHVYFHSLMVKTKIDNSVDFLRLADKTKFCTRGSVHPSVGQSETLCFLTAKNDWKRSLMSRRMVTEVE